MSTNTSNNYIWYKIVQLCVKSLCVPCSGVTRHQYSSSPPATLSLWPQVPALPWLWEQNMSHPHIGTIGNTNYVFPNTLLNRFYTLQPNDTYYNPSVGGRKHYGELRVLRLQDVNHRTNRDYTKFNHFCDSSV